MMIMITYARQIPFECPFVHNRTTRIVCNQLHVINAAYWSVIEADTMRLHIWNYVCSLMRRQIAMQFADICTNKRRSHMVALNQLWFPSIEWLSLPIIHIG